MPTNKNKNKTNIKRPRWKEQDINLLRELVALGMSNVAIAQRLGRTNAAVAARISQSGGRDALADEQADIEDAAAKRQQTPEPETPALTAYGMVRHALWDVADNIVALAANEARNNQGDYLNLAIEVLRIAKHFAEPDEKPVVKPPRVANPYLDGDKEPYRLDK